MLATAPKAKRTVMPPPPVEGSHGWQADTVLDALVSPRFTPPKGPTRLALLVLVATVEGDHLDSSDFRERYRSGHVEVQTGTFPIAADNKLVVPNASDERILHDDLGHVLEPDHHAPPRRLIVFDLLTIAGPTSVDTCVVAHHTPQPATTPDLRLLAGSPTRSLMPGVGRPPRPRSGNFAGLRLGEAAALQVDDVDSLRREIHVRRQVQRVNGGELDIRLPKYNSERTIHAAQALIDILAEHVALGLTNEWLFEGNAELPPHQNTVGHRWRTTLARAEVTVCGCTTFATSMRPV